MAETAPTSSLWDASAPDTDFPALAGDVSVDVAIVGGGIVGLTAARLLKQAGRTVAVLEARRIGRQVTGKSTAKITSQHNLVYAKLIKKFGEAGARAYAEANEAAVAQVGSFVREDAIACELEPKPAYVYATSADAFEQLRAEEEAARRLGLPASLEQEVALPFPVTGALRFDGQAQFHPCRYLAGMAQKVPGEGSHVFEETRVTGVEEGEPCRVQTERGTLAAREVILATHLPFIGEGKFYAKAYPYAHPMLAARIDQASAPEGMFIGAESPTHSFRTAPAEDGLWLVAVGGSYKPGHAHEERELSADLERFVTRHFQASEIGYRWTNEDYYAMDGVPFIGRASSGARHLYVATGFNAWGISGGTVAGMILSDLIAQGSNAWAATFDATRLKPVAGGSGFAKENLEAGKHMLKGHLGRHPGSLDAVQPGRGEVMKVKGEKLAVYRDESGQLHAVSAVCTHLGCVVGWNETERTWDCSCHGSRFDCDGRMLHGPAVKDLERKPIG